MTSRLRAFLKKSSFLKKLKWDLEYRTGTWDFLSSDMEDGRYRNIIALMQTHVVASPSILEMGCGKGVLLAKMSGFDYDSYTGIDFSDVAIRRARGKFPGKGIFETGNMDTWTTDKKFDVIIFNESIYYSNDAVATMAGYASWLNPNGKIIISVFIMAPTQIVLDKIMSAYQPIGEMESYRKEMGYWRQYIFSFD